MPSPQFKPPAPGDEVWYFPSAKMPRGPRELLEMGKSKCLPAVVLVVHTARLIDVEVTAANGDAHLIRSVTLLQDGDPHPDALIGHCQWDKKTWPSNRPPRLPAAGGE